MDMNKELMFYIVTRMAITIPAAAVVYYVMWTLTTSPAPWEPLQ